MSLFESHARHGHFTHWFQGHTNRRLHHFHSPFESVGVKRCLEDSCRKHDPVALCLRRIGPYQGFILFMICFAAHANIFRHRSAPCFLYWDIFRHRSAPCFLYWDIFRHRSAPCFLYWDIFRHRSAPCFLYWDIFRHRSAPCFLYWYVFRHRSAPCFLYWDIFRHRSAPCLLYWDIFRHRSAPCFLYWDIFRHRSAPRFLYWDIFRHRSAPRFLYSDQLRRVNSTLRRSNEEIFNVTLDDIGWAHTKMPTKLGGLYIRDILDLALQGQLSFDTLTSSCVNNSLKDLRSLYSILDSLIDLVWSHLRPTHANLQ